MPVVKMKDQKFLIWWPPAYDEIIMKVGKKYGETCIWHYKSSKKTKRIWRVSWQKARKDGALKKLSKFSNLELSKRHSLLVMYHKDPIAFLDKKKKCNQTRKEKNKKNYYKKKKELWDQISMNKKQKYGWKPRDVWTESQRKLLVKITKSHRRTNTTINWLSVMKDKRIKELPKKYHESLAMLRKYYWVCCRPDRSCPEFKKRRRSYAKKYKAKNLDRYKELRQKRSNAIRSAVHEELFKISGLKDIG